MQHSPYLLSSSSIFGGALSAPCSVFEGVSLIDIANHIFISEGEFDNIIKLPRKYLPGANHYLLSSTLPSLP
jgi:hypothetical protein